MPTILYLQDSIIIICYYIFISSYLFFLFTVLRSKSDQEGRKLDPKPTYQNSMDPFVCPIFALGIYCLLLDSPHTHWIFPGGSQEKSFGTELKRMLQTDRQVSHLILHTYFLSMSERLSLGNPIIYIIIIISSSST